MLDTTDAITHHKWRALSIFVLYRLLISASLAGVFQFQIGPDYLGAENTQLYIYVSYTYLFFAFLCPVGIRLERPAYHHQVIMQVSVDIAAITLIMFSSGGIGSGLGTLLAISVTSSGILLGNTTALALAAGATLALFGEQSIALIYTDRSQTAFIMSGIHGAVFFSTTLLAIMLGARVRQTEEIAVKSREQIERLRKLNEHVIHYMRTGLLVVDEAQNIILKNESAGSLLDLDDKSEYFVLGEMNAALSLCFNNWLVSEEQPGEFSSERNKHTLIPSFTTIEDSEENLYLIFLEDATTIKEHAQNLKLASLGRLTAGIAHEIRNPLGAASHAAQLLNESEQLAKADKQLLDIIQRHCKRMNGIIESIMSMSQRKQSLPQDLVLGPFLESFVKDFSLNRSPEPKFEVAIRDGVSQINFDPDHLIQILVNLCDNGIRYSIENIGEPKLKLIAGIEPKSKRKYLDICDFGKSLMPETADRLFEPFYTTSNKGTGLGLYLSRELCVANRANMSLKPIEFGTCFRILFYK